MFKSQRPPFQDTSFFQANRLSSPYGLTISYLQQAYMLANFRVKVNFPLRSINSGFRRTPSASQRLGVFTSYKDSLLQNVFSIAGLSEPFITRSAFTPSKSRFKIPHQFATTFDGFSTLIFIIIPARRYLTGTGKPSGIDIIDNVGIIR